MNNTLEYSSNDFLNLSDLENHCDISDFYGSGLCVDIESNDEVCRFFDLIYGRIRNSDKVDMDKLILIEDDESFKSTGKLTYIIIYSDIGIIDSYLVGNDFEYTELKKYINDIR